MPVPLALTVPRRPGRQILAQCDTCGLIVALPDRLSDVPGTDLDVLGRCPWCLGDGWDRQDFDSAMIDSITVTVEPSTVGLGSAAVR